MADETTNIHLRDEKRCIRGVDRLIAELARGQHGVVGRGQLLTFAGRGAIDGRIARGALHRVHRGVYAVGHPHISIEGRWMAAVLACGEQSLLSHRSAGQLWGLLPRTAASFEVTRPGRWRAISGVTTHCSFLPGDETGKLLGIPVTSVSRTLFDLAAVLSRQQLERAMNEAEVRRLTDALSLPDLIVRYPRRRGVVTLRSLLAGHKPGGIARSRLEERFVAFLDAHDLPRPRLNADLAVRGRFFEVDCLWREAKLVVELDSRGFHDTGRAFEKDRERDRILLAEGWRVTRVTWRQLDITADAVAADLRDLLRFGAGRPTLS